MWNGAAGDSLSRVAQWRTARASACRRIRPVLHESEAGRNSAMGGVIRWTVSYVRRDLSWNCCALTLCQGRSMASYSTCSAPQSRLSLLQRSLLESEELPFRSILSNQRIAEVLDQEGISFSDDDDVYTPVVTLWTLLSQVFFNDEQRSCLTAVVRVAALWLSWGRVISSVNTGAYCRARRRITAEALREISGAVAAEAFQRTGELRQPDAALGPDSAYVGGRLLLVDGFTVTAADRALPTNST